MNANCYRLVFDRRTRTLVPVAEFTASAKKGNAGGPGASIGGADAHVGTLRSAIVLALALLASGASWQACAQMVVAPSAGAPTLGHTANDTPLVHIANPNAGGNSVYGDKGAYVATTLTLPLAGGLAMFVGADAGAVEDNGAHAPHQVLSGWAVGLRGQWRHAQFSVTHAAPMQAGERDPPDVLYATAGLRF